MTTLTFIDAEVTHSVQDELAVSFVYKVNDSTQPQTIHVVGSENSWGLEEPERWDYVQTLFTGTVAYIEDYWETYEALPDNEKQINSQSDFPPFQPGKTDWKGYLIALRD